MMNMIPSNGQSKWLTYLVFILLSFLTVVMAMGRIEISDHSRALLDMPSTYVRLERYRSDLQDLKSYQVRIESKLDRLIEASGKSK